MEWAVVMKLGTWLTVGNRCTTVNFFRKFKIKVKVTGARKFTAVRMLSNMAARQIDRLQQGQRKRMEVSILWVPGNLFKA